MAAASEQQPVEDGARKSNGDGITVALADVREDYAGRDSNVTGAAGAQNSEVRALPARRS